LTSTLPEPSGLKAFILIATATNSPNSPIIKMDAASGQRRRPIGLSLLLVLLMSITQASALSVVIPMSRSLSIPGNITSEISLSAESAGAGCSTEGQWNCMTTSWQRCASGKWSVIMQMSAGTICTPSGFTTDFRIQASDNRGGTSSASGGLRVQNSYGLVGLSVLSSIGLAVIQI
jgi:hypothetical protein